jgi:hypothetical protein
MQKVAEYRAFANEFRLMAASEPAGKNRDKLLSVARDWEGMARRREVLLFPIWLEQMVCDLP